MPRLKSPSIAAINVPARADVGTVTQIRRVQTQAGDHREHVTVSRVNCEPTSAAALAVTKKIARGQWLFEHSSVMQREGNCSGAIVTVIVKRSMSSTPNV